MFVWDIDKRFRRKSKASLVEGIHTERQVREFTFVVLTPIAVPIDYVFVSRRVQENSLGARGDIALV